MGPAWAPRLPPGRAVDLPGRGTTFVRELPGPRNAPTVVLLHGWTVNADVNWFTAYEALAEHHRVVALDHRGHGRGLRTADRFRLADCADDVAALCDVLGVSQVVPVGYSMGGPIAMLTWHRHRSLVTGMVLCATAPVFGRAGPTPLTHRVLPTVAALARVVPAPVRQMVARQTIGRRFEDDAFGRWARTQLAQGDPALIAEAGTALGRFDNRDWLGEIDVPTSVVRTTQDLIVPPRRQARLAEEIPGAVAIDVDADHSACVTAADRFVPALVSAVRSVTGGVPAES